MTTETNDGTPLLWERAKFAKVLGNCMCHTADKTGVGYSRS
jgi:hypothetical protein